MKTIPGKHLSPFNLFPAPPDTCQECAAKHDPDMPHNRDSLFYQYKFYNEHGRWPTWEDAMAHCPDEMKELWCQALRKLGVEI
ncbi:MAG: hypothetical protein NC238_08990 [Dehalobacter sp.]|nr:hypothetical protein [Dehalobacter sp.]